MKKTFSLIIAILLSISIYAQTPQAYAYQGIARNNTGNPISNQLISIRASILDSSATGFPKYIETQSVTTNSLGLFSVSIGMGTVQSGTFSAIPWAAGKKYMKVEFDPAGGTSYVLSGTQQILSVPYALNALNAKTYVAGSGVSVSGSTITNTAPNQTVTLVPSGATTITGAYPTYTISSPITPTLNLVGSGSTTISGTYPIYTVSSPIDWQDYAIYEERTNSGVASLTTLTDATWTPRQLNQNTAQVGTSISRSGTNITLQPGKYQIIASSKWGWTIPYVSGINYGIVDAKNHLRIRNTNSNTTVLVGESQNTFKIQSSSTGSTIKDESTLKVQGIITISSVTVINLQQYMDYTIYGSGPASYNSGLPTNSGEDEIYSQIFIKKIN